MSEVIRGFIESEEGIYIGDLCYAMNEHTYHKEWGEKHGYEDGVYKDESTGLRYVMAGTSYGDGCYKGSDGTNFPVDAGIIGVMPLEIANPQKEFWENEGKVIYGTVEAYFEAHDGVFRIAVGDETLKIDTRHCLYEEEDEEDDE